ncbi:MAG: hypothetical protein OXU20_03785 [Myxococcales bacterium]|nr:hypothetical protein [Myxococcales bacterium]MDD9966381.1 hypothetical protein [Myxococcales bacterium]
MALDAELPLLVTLARIRSGHGTSQESLVSMLKTEDSKRLAALLLEGAEHADNDEQTARLRAIRQLAGVE